MVRRYPLVCCAVLLTALPGIAPRAAEVTLEQAVERVQKDTQGRVLAAEEVDVGKRKVYRIKVLTREGSVRRVLVSADSKEAEPAREAGRSEKNDKGGKGR